MAINWYVVDEVAGTAAARGDAIEYQTLPPIEYGGYFWQCIGRTTLPATNKIAVYRSADLATWTEQDTGNGPTMIESASYYPGSGNTIYFAYWISAGTEIRLTTFNMDTGLFGTPVTGGPAYTGNLASEPNLWHIRLSNGDRWVFYQVGVGFGYNSIYGVKYDGAWAAPTLIATGTNLDINNSLQGCCADTSDVIYFFIGRTLASTNRRRLIFNSMAAGVLSGEQQLADRVGSNIGRSSTPIFSALDSKVYWAWMPSYTGTNTEIALVSIDTNTLTPTITDVADPTNPNDIWYWTAVAQKANGDIWVFVYNENTIDGVTSILYFIDTGSGFGTEQVYWDDTVDPIASPYVPETNSITASFASDGSLIVTLGGASSDTALCDIRYVSTVSFGPLPLEIICPVGGGSATVGVPFGPYDLNDVVTGGTGPFTFSISGTLPPGVTLVGSTLSGTPTTQGTFDYTITVTDSLGNTATTDPGCSVTVAAAPPPETCETAPAPAYNPTLAIYPDPMEQTGS